jgi:hypothetical protein
MKNVRLRALVGKLSVDPSLFAFDRLETLMAHVIDSLMEPHRYIQERDGKRLDYWVLEPGEIFRYPEDGPEMVAGVVRRVTNLGAVETWDFANNCPGEARVRDMTLVKFHYLFDPATETVVIQQSGKTRTETLMNVFASLVDMNTKVKLGSLTVNAYRKPQLLDELSKFHRITRVRFSLVAANPEQDEDWAEIEQLIMTKPGAKKANIELLGEDLKTERTVIEQGARKIVKAQGNSLYVEGIGHNGEIHRVDSDDFTLSDTIKTPSSRNGLFYGLLGILRRYVGGGSM